MKLSTLKDGIVPSPASSQINALNIIDFNVFYSAYIYKYRYNTYLETVDLNLYQKEL